VIPSETALVRPWKPFGNRLANYCLGSGSEIAFRNQS
jgi:hypothetical protein